MSNCVLSAVSPASHIYVPMSVRSDHSIVQVSGMHKDLKLNSIQKNTVCQIRSQLVSAGLKMNAWKACLDLLTQEAIYFPSVIFFMTSLNTFMPHPVKFLG